MKAILFPLLLLSLISSPQAGAQTAASAASDSVSLFNGKDLTGWEGDPELWKVEDGLIIGTCSSQEKPEHNTFLIWTEGSPADFELHVTARVLGDNNSGVQYRSRKLPEAGPWAITGYQNDIHPAIEHTGMTYEEKGRGIFGLNGRNVVIDPEGSLWQVGEQEPVKIDTAEWNTYSVIARGNHLVHQVNGQTTSELWDFEEARRSLDGLIAIQLHRGNPHRVEIRDIQLKQLPVTAPLDFDAATHLAKAQKMEKPRTSRPQGLQPVSPKGKPGGK